MIVHQADLHEALERAAELDQARRRHRHDEGLRQRLHTAVSQVRRIAGALEGGGTLVLLLVLVACADPELISVEEACAEQAEPFCSRIATLDCPDSPLDELCASLPESYVRPCSANRSSPIEPDQLDVCLEAIEGVDRCWLPPEPCQDIWYEPEVRR